MADFTSKRMTFSRIFANSNVQALINNSVVETFNYAFGGTPAEGTKPNFYFV